MLLLLLLFLEGKVLQPRGDFALWEMGKCLKDQQEFLNIWTGHQAITYTKLFAKQQQNNANIYAGLYNDCNFHAGSQVPTVNGVCDLCTFYKRLYLN